MNRDNQIGVHETLFQAGKNRLHIRVDLPPESQVNILVSAETISSPGVDSSLIPHTGEPLQAAVGAGAVQSAVAPSPAFPLTLSRLSQWITARRSHLWSTATLEMSLLGLAITVYLLTRWVGLADFPIYFFTDEAVQAVLASDFLRDGGRGYDDIFLPTYFLNSYQYNLGVSVYVQVLPLVLFGKSIWVTRGVSVLISLIAAACVGLILKNIFGSHHAWLAVLTLSITPAWFLHSRTAFETSLAVSFYAGFLYFYLMYRCHTPRSLYPAVIFGGLTFYSYSPARMVIGLTTFFFFLSDLPYHWQQRKIVLRGLGLAVLLALPQLRFQIIHPQETLRHLVVLNSYWIQPLSTAEKVQRFFAEYLHGLSPAYWYLPNQTDLPRHIMKDYGHLLRASLPFVLLGLGICLRKLRTAQYRALLLALLAAPSGAALVALGITRALVMVIPAALLTALGISALLEWSAKRWHLPILSLSLPIFAVMASFNVWMLHDALTNGPLWYTDYGMGGMQWGARQITLAVDQFLQAHPQTHLIFSPAWANGTDTVLRFFYSDKLPFDVGSIEGYLNQHLPLDDHTEFVMIPEEYQRASQSPKFTDLQVDQVLNYPNGQPGFYFIRLHYVKNIDTIFEAEREERRKLVEGQVSIGGQPAEVKYSYLDMGPIEKAFDNDPNTLIRSLEANPLQVQVTFEQSRPIQSISVRIGGNASQVTIRLLDSTGGELLAESQRVTDEPNPRTLVFPLERSYLAGQVWVIIQSLNDSEPAHVHLWEITFSP